MKLALRRFIENSLSTRTVRADISSYDQKTRSIGVVAVTQNPVEVFYRGRWEIVNEVLLMDGLELPGNNQVPFIDTHDRSSVMKAYGSARDWKNDATPVPQKSCRIYFDSTEDGKNVEIKYAEGHLTDVSIGYRQLESYYIEAGKSMDWKGVRYNGPLLLTPRARVKELSGAIVGADEATGARTLPDEIRALLVEEGMKRDATDNEALDFYRQLVNSQTTEGDTEMKRNMFLNGVNDPPASGGAPAAAAPAAPLVDRAAVQKEERERVTQINLIASKFASQLPTMEALREDALNKGRSAESFSHDVLTALSKGSAPIQLSTDDGHERSSMIGMSIGDSKQYSLLNAIRSIIEKGGVQGIEKEASDAMVKLSGRSIASDNAFSVPQDVLVSRYSLSAQRRNEIMLMHRDMTGADATKGGYFINTDMFGSELIELLRNKPMVAQAGARTLSGLRGNVSIPRQTGGATSYWLGSNGAGTASDQAIGQVIGTPRRLVAYTIYDKELLFQSSVDVENFVREDQITSLNIEKDRAALLGVGGAEPLGIFNIPTGLNTVTFGGAPTWGKVVDFETALGESNAALGKMAYMTTWGVKGAWKKTPKVSAQAVFLWEKDEVNGYPAFATQQIGSSTNKVLFANWSDLLLLDWAGIDIVVDANTLAHKGQVRLITTLWTDVLHRHAGSFCVSTDSGKQ